MSSTKQSPIDIVFPNTTRPFIANAPMHGFVTPRLATEVTKAGGFGFISGGFDFTSESAETVKLCQDLDSIRELLHGDKNSSAALPIGIGFLTFHGSVADFPTTIIPVLRRYRPSAIWLFAGDPAKAHLQQSIIDSVHALSAEGIQIQVFVQVGTVAAARAAVKQGADVIVAQGIDAGGHQYAQGAGIVTIVPEIRDLLDQEFSDRQVVLLAAGGIVDGRGVAAARALGADGVAMGTRFLITEESSTPTSSQDAILKAADGGPSTNKSTVHDDILGLTFWPKPYDGRAIIGNSYQDHLAGLPLEENQSKYRQSVSEGDNSRRIIWAGTGVALVRKRETASSVIKSTQEQAKAILKRIAT